MNVTDAVTAPSLPRRYLSNKPCSKIY